MIGPRMATMLAFLLTDAPVWPERPPADPLRRRRGQSFNCISVEGHTSTNDTVLLLSSTAATEPVLRGDDLTAFAGMVRSACESLARMIADDGEGATHLITIDVEGCRDRDEARDDRPGRRRQPAGQDRHPRRRPQLGPDRLGRRLRGRPVRGDRALALAQRRPALPRRRPHVLRRRRRSRPRSATNRDVHLRLVLDPRRRRDPLLDLRPDRRVRPAQRRLHDLTVEFGFVSSFSIPTLRARSHGDTTVIPRAPPSPTPDCQGSPRRIDRMQDTPRPGRAHG